MQIEQFYDKGLAHASYAILNDKKIVLIDPERNPKPYYDFAQRHNAVIVGVIETHPHADFISSHLEIYEHTGATIYASKLIGAEYPHTTFDEGDVIAIGNIRLKAINTPGHSPDSICIILEDENGIDHAVFTGDTLFIGDVGRPDLRESAGNITAKREELAKAMYQSRDKLLALSDDVLVYPSHGAGSLCGKNLSTDLSSTIGAQRISNYALQPMTEEEFVKILTEDQPFVPKYFGYNVDVNKKGAPNLQESIAAIPRIENTSTLKKDILIIDGRAEVDFKDGHLPGAINLQDGGKFETWLGSIIGPNEKFYLISDTKENLEILIKKSSKIGYESFIEAAFLCPNVGLVKSKRFDLAEFETNISDYTVVDIRNYGESKLSKYFQPVIEIPLPELRERAHEIPTDKPIMIHCAGGYRSAAGSSIVESVLGVSALDFSTHITKYQPLKLNHV